MSEEGALGSPAAREIVPFVAKGAKVLQNGDEVVFTLDTHLEDDAEFASSRPTVSGQLGS